MSETFKGNCRVLVFLWIVLSTSFLQAQDQQPIPEKVYLHTDRNLYFVGEDLWYKAYNVNAYNNLLFDNSNVLYVELIAPDSKIVARHKTNLELGLGNGDFQLADSLGIKPGMYQLRAYTNWNRNYGDDFVFKKNIEIIDVFEDHSKFNKTPNGTTTIKPTTIEVNKQNTFKIDFFPEGGSLVENVSSVVGFKAVDGNGKPIEIKGELFDSNNELVTAFESAHDGMGKFQLVPIEEKKYLAKIQNSAGEEMKVEFPSILKQGYLLYFRTIKGRNIVSITTNQATLSQNPNAQLVVVCKAKGIPYLESTQTLTATSLSFELPKDNTPEGISQITLFDNTNKPQSERLIYIEKNQDLEVQLLADKASYKPNEKATINVSSKSKEGMAKSASFSLSVTDMNGEVEDKDFSTNICSYFLMESDIRGKVNNPGYYFDAANPKRLEHLDNLLLTQGWRNFLWKTSPTLSNHPSYKAEKGITISGRVKRVFSDKALVNNKLTLALINEKHQNIFSTVTDSLGSFQFENLMFSEMTSMYLNNTNEKGKYRGEIVLDSIERSPISVRLEREKKIFSNTTKSIVENVFKKYTAFGVKSENVLKVVEIEAKKKKNGLPDYSFLVDKKEANKFYTFFDYLMEKLKRKIPKIFESGNSFAIKIDNFPMEEMNELLSLFPDQVIKVEVHIGGTTSFEYGNNTVITIFTTKQTGGQHVEKGNSFSIKQKIKGYDIARIFYVPDPEKLDVEFDNIAAVRNTIYWNPYVHPDKTGNTSVNYYNTKVETKVKVALEGITGDGIPVVKNVYYTIKK